jgi:orotidine-5'-phosphate decarboxylase
MAFIEQLEERTARLGRLCVGIDPHGATLDRWGLNHDIGGLEAFSRGMVEALADTVAVFKPQSAFFEAYGPAGLSVLERTLADIREAGALSILDVKRGDIGSTMSAYAQAYLADDAPLRADAITVSPYLGFGSLTPAVDLAAQTGRGLFVLCRTSNPEGGAVQLATTDTGTVAQSVVDSAQAANREHGTGFVGLVVGATHDQLDVNLDEFSGWILAPGIGAQGGSVDHLGQLFGSAAPRVLPSASREISNAGPDHSDLQRKVSALLSL